MPPETKAFRLLRREQAPALRYEISNFDLAVCWGDAQAKAPSERELARLAATEGECVTKEFRLNKWKSHLLCTRAPSVGLRPPPPSRREAHVAVTSPITPNFSGRRGRRPLPHEVGANTPLTPNLPTATFPASSIRTNRRGLFCYKRQNGRGDGAKKGNVIDKKVILC